MGKNRKKPVRRKGQMKQWSLRSLNTGPDAKSLQAREQAHSKKSIHRVQLEDINGGKRQLVDNPFLDALFPSAGGEGKNEPRTAALRRRAEEIARETGAEPDRAPLVLYKDRLKRITLHCNAQLSRFWFQREVYQLCLVERSVQYSSMAAAKMIFNNGSVDYVHAEVVTSVSSG